MLFISATCCCFSVTSVTSRSTMALQQAQLLLNMSSLEPVNFGVHQNNTEAFAVALCHLAELHAEQVTLLPLLSVPTLTGKLRFHLNVNTGSEC